MFRVSSKAFASATYSQYKSYIFRVPFFICMLFQICTASPLSIELLDFTVQPSTPSTRPGRDSAETSTPPMDSPSPTLLMESETTLRTTSFPSNGPTEYSSNATEQSTFPTFITSMPPSLLPSILPSNLPSMTPSSAPTQQPSPIPSVSPSSFPTMECHDHASYRSPINNLTCADHAGTKCVHWRALGLNATELGDLINQCPESCQIACGTFLQFSISVSFVLANIPGLLDSVAKSKLEEATREFLLAFLQLSFGHNVDFELDTVDMVSQAIVQPQDAARKSLRRNLEANNGDGLWISLRLLLQGFCVGCMNGEVRTLLISGINNNEYIVALQDSDDHFTNAILSSTAEQVESSSPEVKEGSSTTPLATILVSTAFVILVSGFGICSLYRNRSELWWSKVFGKCDEEESTIIRGLPGETISNDPFLIAAHLSSPGVLSHTGTSSSFDDSGDSTLQAANGPFWMGSDTGLRSDERIQSDQQAGSNQNCDNDRADLIQASEYDLCHDAHILTVDEQGTTAEHPLANVIPPMIIIDHIDDQSEDLRTCITALQVPTRRIVASAKLKLALHDRQYQGHPLLCDIGGYGQDVANHLQWQNYQNRGDFSPLGIEFESDSEEAQTPGQRLPTLDFSNQFGDFMDEDNGPSERECISEQNHPLPCLNSNHHEKHSEVEDLPETITSQCAGVEQVHSPTLPPSKRIIPGPLDLYKIAPPQEHTPERPRRFRTLPSSETRNRTMPVSWKPSLKLPLTAERYPRSVARTSIAKIVDMAGYKKASSGASVPLERQYDEKTPPIPLVIEHATPSESQQLIRYEFETPRMGQLGLVISCDSQSGPVVQAIKDYSPLLGLVHCGDRIVEIDNKNTENSTLSEVARMLTWKPGILPLSTSTLRIAVVRPVGAVFPLHGVPPSQSHSRESSYGSSSIESVRSIDDLDVVKI